MLTRESIKHTHTQRVILRGMQRDSEPVLAKDKEEDASYVK